MPQHSAVNFTVIKIGREKDTSGKWRHYVQVKWDSDVALPATGNVRELYTGDTLSIVFDSLEITEA